LIFPAAVKSLNRKERKEERAKFAEKKQGDMFRSLLMKNLLVGIFLFACAAAASAATAKDVSYKSGDDTVQAVLYTPQGKGPFPALVVIHEWWGLNDWVKEQASKLSDEGYVTLAIDLYRGKVATTTEMAHELSRGVPDDRADRDLHMAVDFLKSQSDVKKDKIGAIGWCMGGDYALDVALQEPTLAADVVNYGALADDPDDLKKIHAPILGLFGGQDRGISQSSVKKFEEQMKKLGKSVEVHIYPEAGHAFENPNNAQGYRKDDAADAWSRTVNFLASTLKK
jgi:carboxymethylenebutenolidase